MGALLLLNLALISKSPSACTVRQTNLIELLLVPQDATVDGYQNARFIVPFVLGLLLFPSFCCWEANQEERYAMLPVAIMKEPKFLVVCYTGYASDTP